jgi:hypothetical protein
VSHRRSQAPESNDLFGDRLWTADQRIASCAPGVSLPLELDSVRFDAAVVRVLLALMNIDRFGVGHFASVVIVVLPRFRIGLPADDVGCGQEPDVTAGIGGQTVNITDVRLITRPQWYVPSALLAALPRFQRQ